jgi:hypothetical protein
MLPELAKPETITIGTHLADSVFGWVMYEQGQYPWHTL